MPQGQASQDQTPQADASRDEASSDDTAVSSENGVDDEPRDDASSPVKRPGRTGSYFKTGNVVRDKGPRIKLMVPTIR